MKGKDRLKDYLSDRGGATTARMAENGGIHREYLSESVRLGDLERVSHGIYATPEMWEDRLYVLQLRKSRMVYSHDTALFLHGLTDRDPLQVVVTVPNGYNTSQLIKAGCKVHTVKKDLFDLGICIRSTVHGNNVRTYDMERTICDVLRDRNHQDPAVLFDALRRYVRKPDKDLNKLMRYAAPLRIEKVLRMYLEVLL
jgi:predicted transcriptional regulator of viral defense system